MATGLPSGVTTMSIPSWTRDRLFSSTIIANTEVPAETLPERGRTALVATMPVPASPSGGQSGMPGCKLPGRVDQLCALGGELACRTTRRQDARGGCRAASSPACAVRSARRTSPSRAASQSPVCESIGNMPEASPTPIFVLAGELAVNVAGKRGQAREPRHVGLRFQDRLVEVRDAPALRHREVEQRGQLGAGLAGDVVSPGAERDQQLPLAVEGDVPVHHPAEAQGRDGPQLSRSSARGRPRRAQA